MRRLIIAPQKDWRVGSTPSISFAPLLELPCPCRIAIKAPASDPVRQCRTLTDDPSLRGSMERHWLAAGTCLIKETKRLFIPWFLFINNPSRELIFITANQSRAGGKKKESEKKKEDNNVSGKHQDRRKSHEPREAWAECSTWEKNGHFWPFINKIRGGPCFRQHVANYNTWDWLDISGRMCQTRCSVRTHSFSLLLSCFGFFSSVSDT